MDRQDFDHTQIQGVDADIEIALKEYGFAWIETETDILFYYGVGLGNNEEMDEPEYTHFDFATFNKDTDIFEEYDWVNFEDVRDCMGIDLKTFIDLPFFFQIEALNNYYGYENIFGSSYYPLSYGEIMHV